MPCLRKTRGQSFSMGVGQQRPGELFHEEELAWHRRHEGAREPRRRDVPQRDAEGAGLPGRAAVGVDAVCATDAEVGSEEEAGADRIGEAGDEREAGHEGVEAVLLDGEGVERDAQAMGLLLPLRGGFEFAGELRLPRRAPCLRSVAILSG